jgi:hypothetical protein
VPDVERAVLVSLHVGIFSIVGLVAIGPYVYGGPSYAESIGHLH